MCHTSSRSDEGMLTMSGTNNGIVAKKIQFIGRGAHAGGAPHLGINALNAATLALMAIHATGRPSRTRTPYEYTPSSPKAERRSAPSPPTFAWSHSSEAAPLTPSWRPTRKWTGRSKPGNGRRRQGQHPDFAWLPPLATRRLPSRHLQGQCNVPGRRGKRGERRPPDRFHRHGGCKPAHARHSPLRNGATGLGHGADYVIEDYSLAVTTAGKALACTVIDLLAEGASQGGRVVSNHRPTMSKADYLSFMRGLAREELFDYEEL